MIDFFPVELAVFGIDDAIFGGLLLAGWLAGQIGKGRQTADVFVQTFQNPFDRAMAEIDRQHAAGQITGEEAQRRRVESISVYGQVLEDFGTVGTPEARVVADQAISTFNQYYRTNYGVFFEPGDPNPQFTEFSPLNDFRPGAPDLTPEDGGPGEEDELLNPPSLDDLDPTRAATRAATTQRRRARRLGHSSTFLGGTFGGARVRRPTLLGR